MSEEPRRRAGDAAPRYRTVWEKRFWEVWPLRRPDCPADEELADFVLGPLPPPEAEPIRQHLEHCEWCRFNVEVLTAPPPPIKGSLLEVLAGKPLRNLKTDAGPVEDPLVLAGVGIDHECSLWEDGPQYVFRVRMYREPGPTQVVRVELVGDSDEPVVSFPALRREADGWAGELRFEGDELPAALGGWYNFARMELVEANTLTESERRLLPGSTRPGADKDRQAVPRQAAG